MDYKDLFKDIEAYETIIIERHTRPEVKFNSIEELKHRLQLDKEILLNEAEYEG